MSGRLILYHLEMSPPSRAVRIVARLIGLELELRYLATNQFEMDILFQNFFFFRSVDSFESEQSSEAFIRVLFQTTIILHDF